MKKEEKDNYIITRIFRALREPLSQKLRETWGPRQKGTCSLRSQTGLSPYTFVRDEHLPL